MPGMPGMPEGARRIAFAFAIASTYSCSVLFDPADQGGGANVDASTIDSGSAPDAAVLSLCEPGSCPVALMVHSIGASVSSDFATPRAWLDARSGDLVNRVVLSVEDATGSFVAGESVTGANSGCTGIFIDGGRNAVQRLVLEDPSLVCEIGEELAQGSGATARLLGYLGEGVIEKGEMSAGTYNSTETLNFGRTGSPTDQDHYMWLSAAADSRHLGVAGAGVIFDGTQLSSGQNTVIAINQAFTRLDWIEVKDWPGAKNGISVQDTDVFLNHLILHGGGNTAIKADDLNLARSPRLWLANSLIYDVGFWAVRAVGEQSSVFVANTTAYQCVLTEDAPSNDGCIGAIDGATMEVVNSVAISTRAGIGGDFYVNGGTLAASSSNNASSDTSGPGANSLHGVVHTDVFTDPTSQTPDLKIKRPSALVGAGKDPGWSYDISVDLSGAQRNGSWDIGAY
jgi:hypothetical protein